MWYSLITLSTYAVKTVLESDFWGICIFLGEFGANFEILCLLEGVLVEFCTKFEVLCLLQGVLVPTLGTHL